MIINLSPYEKNRIIPNSFGLTEMGRDLLAQDYILKQITASLIYPEDVIGKKFWKRIYEKAIKKYKTSDIPVNTFNKVWILPEKAVVYENIKAKTAYVLESKLKVMLEQDYLSLKKHEGIQFYHRKDAINCVFTNQLGSQIVREIVIPELTKEVNENKNFAKLRQVYNSLILATWYKKKIKDSILNQVYTDKNKVAGVNIDDQKEKEKIYQQYLKAFKKGVFNYIKEDMGPEGETIPRKYFSGGMNINPNKAMTIVSKANFAMLSLRNKLRLAVGLTTSETSVKPPDQQNKKSRSKRGIKKIVLNAFAVASVTVLISIFSLLYYVGGINGAKYIYQEYINIRHMYVLGDVDWDKSNLDINYLRRCFKHERTELIKSISDIHVSIELDLPYPHLPTRKDKFGIIHNGVPIQQIVQIITPMLEEQMKKVDEDHKRQRTCFAADAKDLLRLCNIISSLGDIGIMRRNAEVLHTFPDRQKRRLIAAINDLQGIYMLQEYNPNLPTLLLVNGWSRPGLASQEAFIYRLSGYNIAFLNYDSWSAVGPSADLLAQKLKLYPFGKKFVLVGASNGCDVIRKMILDNQDLDLSKTVFIELVPVYGGAAPAELNKYLPGLAGSLNMADIVATHDPNGEITGQLYSDRGLREVAERVKCQVSYTLKGDSFAPKPYNSKEFWDRWKHCFNFGTHIIVPEEVGIYHAWLTLQEPVINSLIDLLNPGPLASMGHAPYSTTTTMTFKPKHPNTQGLNRLTHDPLWVINQKKLNTYLEQLRQLYGFGTPETLLGPKQSLPGADGGISQDIKSETPNNDRTTKGGIDLTLANMNLQTQNNGSGIKLHLDPVMLKKLQNAPGFIPVIISIQAMLDLRQFLVVP
ncbi:MAG: hypothetical protein HQL13_04130 [Candidatus Omnitrophica bacterium]|nr:hypothetical protein [Candidatus Omnitrophota bacterium]